MAVTTEQVLSEISSYRAANARPCPAKYLVDKLGPEALEVVQTLKNNGTLVGKRGRTGGLVPAAESSISAPQSQEDNATADTVADQFAALAAKLAADDVAVAVG